MKHLRETFTDQEFEYLLKVKKLTGMNWHDFLSKWMIVSSVKYYIGYGVPEITKDMMVEALESIEEMVKTK